MRTRRSKAILTAAVATVAALTLLTGCMRVTWLPGDGDIEVFGSAGLETRQFDFTSFTKVEAGQDFEVDLIRADTHKVSITMNENLFEYLDTSQWGEVLQAHPPPWAPAGRGGVRQVRPHEGRGGEKENASNGLVILDQTRPPKYEYSSNNHKIYKNGE